jgi:hypothetical protein
LDAHFTAPGRLENRDANNGAVSDCWKAETNLHIYEDLWAGGWARFARSEGAPARAGLVAQAQPAWAVEIELGLLLPADQSFAGRNGLRLWQGEAGDFRIARATRLAFSGPADQVELASSKDGADPERTGEGHQRLQRCAITVAQQMLFHRAPLVVERPVSRLPSQ